MFKKIERVFDNLFMKVRPIPPGLYTYMSDESAQTPYKWQLRIEPDGDGIMVLNAKTVLHLNESATEFAYHLSMGQSKDQIVKQISERYDSTPDQISQDFDSFKSNIYQLLTTEDLDPVTYLGIERVTPHSKKQSAPLRVDCALTYRLKDDLDQSLAPADRVSRELTTSEWLAILEKLYSAGVPQVVFTGGEPTLRPDLPEIIAKTETLGIVSGLLTNGLKFSENAYLDMVLSNGLDHILILAEDENPDFWKALKNLVAADIAITVHQTIYDLNTEKYFEIFNKLHKYEIHNLSLSSNDQGLIPFMEQLSEKATNMDFRLIWDLPVPYSAQHPFARELEFSNTKFTSGAGVSWLYIEPDGDVLPAQGINKVIGNILKDPWGRIWKHR